MPKVTNYFHKKSIANALLGIAVLLASCTKATVNFGGSTLEPDPNVAYIDSITVNLSTYQTDSFTTSGDTLFIVGSQTDSVLGTYASTAFMQLGVPATNPLSSCTDCYLDSIAFVGKFSGSYYGDTTGSFTLSLHQLNEQMIADETSIGYNVSKFGYDAATMGDITFSKPKPSKADSFSIRLSDALGQEWMDKMKRGSDTMTDITKFTRYFNGLALTGTSSNNNAIYYFQNINAGNATVIRLYYRVLGVNTEHYSVDFPLSPSTYQFNSFSYNRTGSLAQNISTTPPKIVSSDSTNGYGFLHANSGLYPHIKFRDLYFLKELNPYVKVVKATLEVSPRLYNYGPQSIYTLPAAMAMYLMTSDDNLTLGSALYSTDGSTVQTGSLNIDYLDYENTKYSYDLTSYVNTVLATNSAVPTSFVLIPSGTSSENRLVLQPSDIKLKLYVLGL
ncbi:MAG: DUF4270 family protein [Edaphocola sp.]